MSKIQPTEITQELKTSYLNYAMSVIVSRALPDVRDGLKPVQRRILYAMYKMRLFSYAKFSKSAKVVGEVLGKYHPHGDVPVYDALVRMAQPFTMRYPLIQGQGNFGSIDGDPPAAMRYTEAKLTKIAEEMLTDIEKETVEFVDNFDGTLKEPLYLPAKLPNLLLMGAEGIAVGMATKIPPHNLSEVVDALVHMIDTAKFEEENGEKKLVFPATLDEIMQFIKGPDFPTAGIIYGIEDIKKAYSTGKGKILIRGKVEQETIKNRQAIVIKELPYQVNKANLVSKIAQLVVDKKITGIADLRDESDREGIRIVIELKRDAAYKKVLNNLYKYTELQTNFPVNFVCLVNGIPQTISLKTALEEYLKHRIIVVRRRSEYELKQAKHRAHILEGLLIALDHIDEVIEIIKKSKDEATAKAKLMERFKLTDIQAQAILDMQLKRLTALERTKIEDELVMLKETIEYLEGLLKDVFKILKVIKEELLYLKDKFGDERKTQIIPHKPEKFTDEQLIQNRDVILMLTHQGYIKKLPKGSFKIQRRGGVGTIGIEVKDEDQLSHILPAQEHDFILFFTNFGRVFKLRVWKIPETSKRSKGKALVNFLNLKANEQVSVALTYSTKDNLKDKYLFFITKKGTVKKTPFSDFENIKSNGIIAIRLQKGDELRWVLFVKDTNNIMLFTRNGKAITFKSKEVRPMGRAAKGVKGIELAPDDEVVAADTFEPEEEKKDLVIITENGIGKLTQLSEFKLQHRGGKGIKSISIDKKTGKVTFVSLNRNNAEKIIISTQKGQIIKISLKDIPKRSRNAKGVRLIRSKDGDSIATAALV